MDPLTELALRGLGPIVGDDGHTYIIVGKTVLPDTYFVVREDQRHTAAPVQVLTWVAPD